MASERPTTAAELERLTPDQRAALVNSRAVIDVDQADGALLKRARAAGRELLEGLDRPKTP